MAEISFWPGGTGREIASKRHLRTRLWKAGAAGENRLCSVLETPDRCLEKSRAAWRSGRVSLTRIFVRCYQKSGTAGGSRLELAWPTKEPGSEGFDAELRLQPRLRPSLNAWPSESCRKSSRRGSRLTAKRRPQPEAVIAGRKPCSCEGQGLPRGGPPRMLPQAASPRAVEGNIQRAIGVAAGSGVGLHPAFLCVGVGHRQMMQKRFPVVFEKPSTLA